jgi:hypothetical protein
MVVTGPPIKGPRADCAGAVLVANFQPLSSGGQQFLPRANRTVIAGCQLG